MEGIEKGSPWCDACGEVVLTVNYVRRECPLIDKERKHYFGKKRPSFQELLGKRLPNERLPGFLKIHKCRMRYNVVDDKSTVGQCSEIK